MWAVTIFYLKELIPQFWNEPIRPMLLTVASQRQHFLTGLFHLAQFLKQIVRHTWPKHLACPERHSFAQTFLPDSLCSWLLCATLPLVWGLSLKDIPYQQWKALS